jgi:Outer membrane protein
MLSSILLLKKPTADRYLGYILGVTLGLLISPGLTSDQGLQDVADRALTEIEAVRLGLSQPEINGLWEGEIGITESEQMAAKRWPNPEFSYSREAASSVQDDAAQDFFWLMQRLDVSGRRGLKTEAAEHRVRSITQATEFRRIELEAEIRQRFYELLQRQERVEAVGQWLSHMENVAGIVRRQAAAGEVSAYDLKRLAREEASVRARLDIEHASLVQAQERLKALLGLQDTSAVALRVEGTLLLPPVPPAPLESHLTNLATRPDLLGLEQQAVAAEHEGQAAGRWWIPEITLGVGVKQIDQGPRNDVAPLVGVSIPIPLLDRQQAERARAAAQAQRVRNEHSLMLARAVGDVRGLWQQVNALADAARRFREQAVEPSPTLVRIAEAAYQGGQTSILELLDAHRSALEAELQALDLEMSAQHTHIELDRVTGRSLVSDLGRGPRGAWR